MPRLALAACLLWSLGAFLLAGQTGPRLVPTAEIQNEVIEIVRDYILRPTHNDSNLSLTLMQRQYSASSPGQWQLQRFERTSGDSPKIGQFRNMLREPFELATLTSFKWDHWGTLRGRLTYVFAYVVERSRSGWHISQDSLELARAYSGLVYVNVEQRVVLRITRKTVDVPATSKVEEASAVLDYPLAKVGVSRLLLPFKAEEQVRSENLSTRTVVYVYLAPAHLTPIGEVTLASSK